MGQFQKFMSDREEQNMLLESGFSRLAQMMSGLVPSVKSFAILTWENPMGQPLSREENEKLNSDLRHRLASGAYGYRQIKGKYGNFENPFFIMNIGRDEAVILGVSGKQDSVLFGKVDKEFDVTFQLIYCFKDEVHERHVWKQITKPISTDFGGKKTPEEKQKRKEEERKVVEDTDLYSEYKGRRFVVPFFDDEYHTYDNAKFDKGKIVGREEKIQIKNENNIFYASDFDEITNKKVETVMDEAGVLSENFTGKHKWLYRGLAFSILKGEVKTK